MHYYQFNIGDYRRDTQHLTMLEHGAYRQLLDWIYLDEKPIPRETDVVFRRLCARTDEDKEAVIVVLNELFELTENGYIQSRCMNEIEVFKGRIDRARNNGKLGGRPKKTEVVISGLSKKTQREPRQKLTNNQEPNNLLTNNQDTSKTYSAAFALPDWVDKTQWDLWMKTRKGKKMIPEQMQKQVEKLKDWRDAGMDHCGALANSALNGWTGLFLPDGAKGSLINVFSEKPWHTLWSGIEAKAKELKIEKLPDEPPLTFRSRVYEAAGLID